MAIRGRTLGVVAVRNDNVVRRTSWSYSVTRRRRRHRPFRPSFPCCTRHAYPPPPNVPDPSRPPRGRGSKPPSPSRIDAPRPFVQVDGCRKRARRRVVVRSDPIERKTRFFFFLLDRPRQGVRIGGGTVGLVRLMTVPHAREAPKRTDLAPSTDPCVVVDPPERGGGGGGLGLFVWDAQRKQTRRRRKRKRGPFLPSSSLGNGSSVVVVVVVVDEEKTSGREAAALRPVTVVAACHRRSLRACFACSSSSLAS